MSDMQKYVTGETIAISLRMVRKAQKIARPIILVEGTTDVRLYRWMIGPAAEVVPGTGKENVLQAVERIDDCWGWCICVLDADFDRILGIERDNRILLTDLHDIECEYFRSDAFKKTLDEFCSFEKLRKAFPSISSDDLGRAVDEVRESVIAACAVIGCLRLVSAKKGFGLRFRGIDHRKVLSPKTVDVDLSELVRVVLANGAAISVSPDQLVELINAELEEKHDCWQLCQGHDLVSISCIGIRRVWGDGKINEYYLDRALRLAFEAPFFWSTHLGQSLAHKLQEMGSAV